MRKSLLLASVFGALAIACSATLYAEPYDPGPNAEATVAKSIPDLYAPGATVAFATLTATRTAPAVLAEAVQTDVRVSEGAAVGTLTAIAVGAALGNLPKRHRLHEHPGELRT